MNKRDSAMLDLGRQLGLKGGFHRLSTCTNTALPSTNVFTTETAVQLVAGDHAEAYVLRKVISPRWSMGLNPSSGMLMVREAATGDCCVFVCPLTADIRIFTAWMLKAVVSDVVLAPEPAPKPLLPPEMRAKPSQPMRWNL